MQDDRTTWFNPKHVMLTFDYPNDKLIVTRKSTGQQITLTIPDIYKEKNKKTGEYIIEDTYTEYLKHKHHDLENHKKKHEIIPYRIELLKDLIYIIEKHKSCTVRNKTDKKLSKKLSKKLDSKLGSKLGSKLDKKLDPSDDPTELMYFIPPLREIIEEYENDLINEPRREE